MNGNVAVAKVALSEITDDTNSARAFGWIGVGVGLGRVLGPALGGLLARPTQSYPDTFGGSTLLTAFPFALPCMVASVITLGVWLMLWCALPETLHPVVATPPGDCTGAAGGNASAQLEPQPYDKSQPEEQAEMEDASLIPRSRASAAASASTRVARFDPESHGGEAVALRVASVPSVRTAVAVAAASDDDDDDDDNDGDDGGRGSDGSGIAVAAAISSTAPSPPRPPATLQPPPHLPRLSVRAVCAIALRSLTDVSMWRLLRDGPIAASTGLYAMLGLVGLVSNELWPLYVLNDRRHGGFDWTSRDIGLVAATAGPLIMAFQAFVYGPLVSRFGLVRLTRWSLFIYVVALATTPMCSVALLASPAVQWAVLATHFCITTLCRVATFISVFVFVANCGDAANRGRVNAVGQALVSVVRSVGPPVATAAFAWTVSPANTAFGWPFNYYFMWYVMTGLALATLWLTYQLPDWIERKRV
jgi:hypothetical protein